MARKLGYRAWQRQPVGPAGINWGHPRAEGLAFFAPLSGAHGTRDLVRGQLGARTGLEEYRPSQFGAIHHAFRTGNYASFPEVPASIGPTTPFTVAWTQEPRSPSGYATVVACQFGTGGVDYGFVVYQGTSADAYSLSAGARGGGTAQGNSWASSGVLTDQQLDRFVLTSSGGPTAVGGTTWRLWRNGVLLTRDGDATFGANTTAQFLVGAREGPADPFPGLLGDMRMWARVLSDGDAEEESTIAGSWELYAPQRILVPVSAGGGGGVVGTSSVTLQVTAASAGTVAVAGASSGSLAMSGAAAGAVAVAGASSVQFALSGTAAGAVQVTGASTQSLTMTGTATGVTTNTATGASDQTLGFSGSAVGAVAVDGASAGQLALSGSATGVLGGVSVGGSDQSFSLLATSAGAVSAVGQSAQAFGVSGQATGINGDGSAPVGGYSDGGASKTGRKKQTVIAKDDRDERRAEFDALLARVKSQAADKAEAIAQAAAKDGAALADASSVKPPRMPEIKGVPAADLKRWMPDLLAEFRQEFGRTLQAAAEAQRQAIWARDEDEISLLALLL